MKCIAALFLAAVSAQSPSGPYHTWNPADGARDINTVHSDVLLNGAADAQDPTDGESYDYLTTTAPAAMPTNPALAECTYGDSTQISGWHGPGAGDQYCNLWKCYDGAWTKVTGNCGEAALPGDECSATWCQVVTKTIGDHDREVIVVHHKKADNTDQTTETVGDTSNGVVTYDTQGRKHECRRTLAGPHTRRHVEDLDVAGRYGDHNGYATASDFVSAGTTGCKCHCFDA